MRLDTHQHFWTLTNEFTDWPTADLAAIYRDFGSDDLALHLAESRIDGTILVQAAPSVAETEFCLEIAAKTPFIKGVVGWIDFEAADALAELQRLARNPLLKGLRPMVQSITESRWLLRDDFAPIFQAMVAQGLRLDGLVRNHQIGELNALAQRYPGLAIILDHAGKPPIASGVCDGWTMDISRLAGNANVHCKLSGLWTEAGPDCSIGKIKPWVDHLLATFGPDRLIWGSDWPVIELAGSYGAWLGQCEELLAPLSADQQAAIFGNNGRRFYGLD